ncbi:DUF2620 domain-containing protein [Bacillaceae bacterium ZC4]|jgi:Protein of unknown function DUF2620.|uniref:DUF2620 domain-containing protein n=1 Tax=Aeribacillus pallidus TaxID=33936 RepID=A0A163Z6S9_9BACI|nr:MULTISPECIES: DUF2620 domain-containing protein [Bacillaceae]AXI38304.1 DUF2620 domain-containing protein [Bacillaceae bacterium ZC4]REJ22994.1 MAG: DUF2620 domain-containing protein [Bacillaceae bacterium]KZM54591.1 hypothetical protein A3Q35_14530 [Aeribacillus pallidus]KZN95441.1 hypothetical protein AZI98_13430 [Aeribacillus pallidus]MED0651383.1 DUF2620 domain-containing protein [Aeribacillus composti]
MVRIVIGGQLNKQAIEKQVKEIGGNNVEVSVKSDLEAVMAVKNKKADYYIGACETGSGGALAMAIALLGKDKCVTLASPSTIKTKEEIEKEVNDGKIAFGFTASSSKNILNILIPALLK